jgi:two-component system, OmpR family, phosphate regulon sensor histidine kinase PhoR
MTNWLGRLLKLWLVLAVGAALGWLVGMALGWPGWGSFLGAVLLLSVTALREAGRVERLLSWLRGDVDQPAPRDAGVWGEMAYRIERALRQKDKATQEERLRLTQFLAGIEASPNGVMLLDRNDQITWCNSQAAAQFGIDPKRDLLQRVTNLIRNPSFVNFMQGREFDEPISLSSPRGQSMLSVLIRPYGDGQKLVLSQDVTEGLRLEAMRRDFVANVSHEIRTPLTVLSGFVETLDSVPLTAVEHPRVLALMRQQTQRIQLLVDDLLTLAQLEGSPRPSPDHWAEADPLLQRIEADAQALSGGKHQIRFVTQPRVQLAGVEPELQSAFNNLVTNAIRYTPAGGTVSVRWSVREGDGAGVFEVQDTGVGIAREHWPRLTERFYRVDGSRSRDTGGTGLGLAIVKHVVQRHGGVLEIDSEPGQGSTFRIALPASRVRAGAASAPSTQRAGSALAA